jgi:hypothetical protein
MHPSTDLALPTVPRQHPDTTWNERYITSSESEQEGKSIVDRAKLESVEAPRCSAEAGRVDHRRLLDEDAGLATFDLDRRPEAGRQRARRGRRDKHSAEPEEFVCLHDDRVPGTALFVSTSGPRSRQVKELSSDHVSVVRAERARPSAP